MSGQGRKQGSSGSGDAAGNLVHVIGPLTWVWVGKSVGDLQGNLIHCKPGLFLDSVVFTSCTLTCLFRRQGGGFCMGASAGSQREYEYVLTRMSLVCL